MTLDITKTSGGTYKLEGVGVDESTFTDYYPTLSFKITKDRVTFNVPNSPITLYSTSFGLDQIKTNGANSADLLGLVSEFEVLGLNFKSGSNSEVDITTLNNRLTSLESKVDFEPYSASSFYQLGESFRYLGSNYVAIADVAAGVNPSMDPELFTKLGSTELVTSNVADIVDNGSPETLYFATDIKSLVTYDDSISRWVNLTEGKQLSYEVLSIQFNANNQFNSVPDSINEFIVGSSETQSGPKSCYVSSDNSNPSYEASQICHMYIDLPLIDYELMLSFYWKCEGEVGWDWGSVYLVGIGQVPEAGLYLDDSTRLLPKRLNDSLEWVREEVSVDLSSDVRRLVFSFKSDSLYNFPPGLCIDNLKLNYNG